MEKSIPTQLNELNQKIDATDKDLRKWDDFLERKIKDLENRVWLLEHPEHKK